MRLVGPESLDPDGLRLDDDLLVHGNCARVLSLLPTGAFDLVAVDPPFNTGQRQVRRSLGTVAVGSGGDRTGFGGRRYASHELGELAFADEHEDYLGFLVPQLAQARRLLAAHGTLYVHLDPREAHYVKVALDGVFGRDAFLNEIVWAYDYGAKPRRRWPAKHDTILVYVRTPGAHYFDADAVDREPYMAPGLVTAEQAARGKRPTDTWWHTIVATNGAEKTGYPTQKPEGIVRRMVAASSRPGGWCLDFFAGSGTLGAVCRDQGRRFVLVDSSADAVTVMSRRLGDATGVRIALAPGVSAGHPSQGEAMADDERGDTEDKQRGAGGEQAGDEKKQDLDQRMRELEENPPEKLEDWPEDELKMRSFGGKEGQHGYEEGPESNLGPSDLRYHEDGKVTVGGQEVDNPDDYKSDPIPGGPTDPNAPKLSGED